MTKKLLHLREIRELWERTNALLGYDLLKLCLEGPTSALKGDITRAQPATFMGSVMALTAHRLQHPEDFEHCIGAAGLSLGVYAALVAADAIAFDECLHLVDLHARATARLCATLDSGMLTVFTHPSNQHIELVLYAARRHCFHEYGMDALVDVANYLTSSVKVLGGHREVRERSAAVLCSAVQLHS